MTSASRSSGASTRRSTSRYARSITATPSRITTTSPTAVGTETETGATINAAVASRITAAYMANSRRNSVGRRRDVASGGSATDGCSIATIVGRGRRVHAPWLRDGELNPWPPGHGTRTLHDMTDQPSEADFNPLEPVLTRQKYGRRRAQVDELRRVR